MTSPMEYYEGPCDENGVPDMDSAEWNDYCARTFWAAYNAEAVARGAKKPTPDPAKGEG